MFFCSQIFCISTFLSYAEIVALTGSQVEEDVVRGAAAGRGGAGGSSRASAGILAEEAQAIHNAKNMAMTFWNNLSGLAGDAEFDKVDTYLRMIIEKQITSKEGGNMISQFKKERMVQKHLVAAAGLETWEDFKDEFTAYWSSQEKIEGLIGCLPVAARGGARRGAGEVPAAIFNYVENARANLKEAEQPSATFIEGLHQVEVLVDVKLYREARTQGPEPAMEGEGELQGDEPTHLEDVTMFPQWKVVKSSFEDLTAIPRLPMTGAIIDGNYALDKEKTPNAMTKEAVKKFLEDFNSKTTAPAWTVCFFCGFVQQNDFLEVVDNYCSSRAERFFWHKQGVKMNANKLVRFNDLECGVLGYHVKTNAAGTVFKKPQWMCNFEKGDAERDSRSSLIRGFPVVHQMFERDGKTVNNHQKPQALLMELIQVHMLGDNPGKLDDKGRPLNWILDGCCGVASTSMAALRCGMNAFAFDHDQFMVSSAQQRLNNFDDEPDAAEETQLKKKPAKAKEVEKAEPAEAEDEEEEEEQAGPSGA